MADTNGGHTINHMIEAATKTANRGSDLAMAAGQIISARVALMGAAATDPMGADHAELGRMVPEKVEAFSAAGMIMMEHSNQAGLEMTRLASDEMMTAATATMAMATCTDPLQLMEAQGAFAAAWFDRLTTNFVAMGMMALKAQDAAMKPIQDTVAANTERLGG